MTRREEFTAWICAQTGSAYVWGAQGHKVRRDGTVYMNQRKVSDNFESWVRQRENGEENARRAISGIRQRLTEGANEVTCYDCSGLIMAYIRDIKGYTKRAGTFCHCQGKGEGRAYTGRSCVPPQRGKDNPRGRIYRQRIRRGRAGQGQRRYKAKAGRGRVEPVRLA